MNWDNFFKWAFDKSNVIAGAMLTMFALLIGDRFGYFSRLPTEWYYGILFAGIFATMTLISGAVITVWPRLKKRATRRRDEQRWFEYGLKNFETLTDYERKCLLYIFAKGKQRFKDDFANHTLTALLTHGLLLIDDWMPSYNTSGSVHYRVPDHIWKRMEQKDWATGIKLDSNRPPWSNERY